MAKWLKEGKDAGGFTMEEEKEKRIGKERKKKGTQWKIIKRRKERRNSKERGTKRNRDETLF